MTFAYRLKLLASFVRQCRSKSPAMNHAIEILLAAGALVAAAAVGTTCLIGLVVWLGGQTERPAE